MSMLCCALPIMIGWFILPYYLQRKSVLEAVRNGVAIAPVRIFLESIMHLVVWIIAECVLLLFLSGVEPLLGLVAILGGIYALFYCVAHFFETFKIRQRLSENLAAHAVSKYQIWMQDIIVAAISGGVCMTIFYNLFNYDSRAKAMVMLQCVGLIYSTLLAVNMLRYDRDGLKPRIRVKQIALVVFFGTIPCVAIVYLMAWRTTAYALGHIQADEKGNRSPSSLEQESR